MDYSQKCLEECKKIHEEEPYFCNKACKFDPDLNWIFLGFDKEGSAYFYYVEKVEQPYIFLKEKVVRMWVKKIFSNEAKQKHPEFQGVDYQIMLEKINCTDKTFEIVKTINYASDGSVIKESWRSKWDYIVPGSMERQLWWEVCM